MLPAKLKHWSAPAKLNLFLNIVGQRDDGYHTLQTVFQILDFSDRLAFARRDDGAIFRPVGNDAISAKEDLAVRAADILQRESNTHWGVDIYIDKQIPIGGGLGGGSSNAATALVALNEIWECGFDKPELAEMGLELGADVPVFVYGDTAWGEGIGEQLTPISLPKRWYVVIDPGVSVSTAKLFAHPQLTRDGHPITIADFLATGYDNAFEPLVKAEYPRVAEALEWLGQFAPAKLTGTGACVFAALDSRFEASMLLQQLPASMKGFSAAGVQYSPLYQV